MSGVWVWTAVGSGGQRLLCRQRGWLLTRQRPTQSMACLAQSDARELR